MISRGNHNDFYLYEVTEQDLLLPNCQQGDYRVGNVLIFANKRQISLGNELARADDIDAAHEFLDSQAASSSPTFVDAPSPSRPEEPQEDLVNKIAQRDELLRELSESLKSQEQDNELLYAILETTRERLALEEARREEIIDDLQMASAETLSMDSTLERVMEEKSQLEQELAERITELLDLNLQCDDLKQRLAESQVETTEEGRLPADQEQVAGQQSSSDGADADNSQLVTMASGKQIRIYHEFPNKQKLGAATRFSLLVTGALRIAGIIIVAALVMLGTSVFATAKVNGCSFGAALDLLLKSLGLQ